MSRSKERISEIVGNFADYKSLFGKTYERTFLFLEKYLTTDATYTSIGQEHNLSRERVREVIRQAVAHIQWHKEKKTLYKI